MKAYSLVCAAPFAAEDFRKRYKNSEFDAIVAVDSGYEYLKQEHIEPDVCLGDFDSLGYVPDGALRYPAIKDKSDLEMALNYAQEQGAQSIVVYGCLGDRLDHTLAALQTMASVAESGLRIRAVDSTYVQHFFANQRKTRTIMLEVLSGPAQLSFHAGSDDVPEQIDCLDSPSYACISLFAACAQATGVCLEGMYYPLHRAIVNNRSSLGLSNEMTEKQASVLVERGSLFVLYPADLHTTYLKD